MAHGEDSYLRQKIMREQNPMDHENEEDQSPTKQRSQDRMQFEKQVAGRQSINDDLLDDELPGQAYENQDLNSLVQQRNKMIFDDNLEMSERKHGNMPNPDSNYGDSKLNKYESKPEFVHQQPYEMHVDSQQVQTAHFKKQGTTGSDVRGNTDRTQKTDNPDKDQLLIEQRAFHEADEALRKNQYTNEDTGQFGSQRQVSPKMKQPKVSQDDQISSLLAQLQAPMQMDQQQQFVDIDKAHQQMQESIKQMRLGDGGNAFNGQNSLYELAQRVGQPLSSSNVNSLSNFEGENEFQKFLQGEGSIGSQYHNLATQSESERGHHAIDQAQQLLIQMQDSGHHKPMMAANAKQRTGNQMFEKENFNGKNIIQTEPVYLQNQYQNVQFNQPPPQQQPQKKPLSLAERARMARNVENSSQANYNQQFQQYQQSAPPMPIYHQQNQAPQQPAQNQFYRQKFNPQEAFQVRDFQASQPPQNLPFKGNNVDFSKTNKDEKIEKRAALLAQFDDIPIHQLHKADGYQLRNIDDDEQPLVSGRPSIHEAPDQTNEAQDLSLKDQCFHSKWKVRQQAFKEINRLFMTYKPQKEIQREDEMYGDPDSPFDSYGPIIGEIIKDNNLTAQYEALNCLYSFVKFGNDVKSVTFTCCPYILDKIQHNKANLSDICQRILQQMLIKKQNVFPEILKRLKTKNQKSLVFYLTVMNQALTQKNHSIQEANLKLIFKSCNDLLSHNIKEIRDQANQLIIFVYENCEDDVETFCHNLSGLRPVQIKDIKEQLSDVQKDSSAEYLVKLFDKNFEGKKDDQPEKSPVMRSKSVESAKDQSKAEEDQSQIDLSNLVPSNFNEIPYITQINTKRKAMEQFNQELQKLVNKPQVSSFEGEEVSLVKLNKDYSSIYNIVVHMLEDPNMLVFNEALKTLEYLAIILRQSIKSSKMKQFVQLLADKYKETKTAVLVQSEKTFNAIYENRCLPINQFYDLLINQISVTHKNHRVKQLVIDRVEIIIQKNFISEDNRSVNTSQLVKIFECVKDKLKQIILKDTHAGVRDAGVSLLATFRIVAGLDGNFDDIQPILEIINSLPKQRISEISARLENFQEQNGGSISARDLMQEQRSRSKSRGVSAKSRGDKSQKSQDRAAPAKQDQPSSPKPGSTGNQRSQFLFETKRAQATVDSQFQASMSDIIMTIKNISQENDRLRTAQIFENFEVGIEELGDEGIQQCKQHIVQCIYWLFTNYPSKVNFLDSERQEAIKAVLNLLKKLYCIDRSVSRVQTTPNGESLELYHAVSAAVICFGLIQENFAKKIVQMLNILHVAATSTAGESTLSFLNVFKQIVTKYNPCPKLIPDAGVLITSNIIYYAAEKIPEFVQQSQASDSISGCVQLSDFDELSQIAMESVQNCDPNQKEILIQSLIFLKEQMTQHRTNQISAMKKTGQGYNLQEDFQQEQFQEEPQPTVPRHIEVMDLINSNFEQGLLKMKQLVKDEQSGSIQVSEDQKKQILLLLLKMTTQGYSNQKEQYKQAYSLKALMWLKDEFIGLEETFKLTNDIMDVFAQAIISGKDSSIEQYLLNFWIKDLSLRDLVDRIQVTCRFEPHQPAQFFNILFTWLFNQKIQPQNEEPISWVLEDFRKIAPHLAENVLQSGEQEQFFKLSVEKFTAQKVRDFMEIQLIQENQLLLKFLDHFDSLYNPQTHIRISKNNTGDCELSQALFSANESLQEPLLTNRSNLLQEKRDKLKMQKEQDDIESTLADEKKKYDEIMQRLDKYKSQKQGGASDEDRAQEQIDMPPRNEIRVTNTSKGNRPESRPVSGRYQASRRQNDGTTSLDEFGDEEDFKLSTDDRYSIPNQTGEGSVDDQKFMQDRINMQNMQRNPISSKSTKAFGEGLQSATPFGDHLRSKNTSSMMEVGSQDFNTNSESFLLQSRQKIKDSVMNQEERMQRLESSQIKVRQYKNEMESLEEEKRKLEAERRALFNEQNKETEQWKERYREMTLKNDEIIQNLAEANQSYMRQVGENENLMKQVQQLQAQHREFTERYRQMEEQLLNSQKQVEEQKIQLDRNSLPKSPSRASTKESNEDGLHKIEEAFDNSQMMKYGENVSEGQVGVLKIQELLLDSDGANKNLSKSMIQHYCSLKSKVDRMQMIHSLKQSLDHEDILFAISIDVYKSLLNFLLRAFSFEKELIERESMARQHEREQQNELTQESQRLVSKLLNSKEFTTSLLCLLNLLKTDAMPDDFTQDLSIQERQYLRVIMRCISRITKALHSENPDLIRAFDILIEMQKLFVRHPPENLRQDLPCLQDFDFVYRGLKDVSDKLIELQPQKCASFIEFCDASASSETEGLYTKPNAFIKYIRQMMQNKQ